MASTQDLELQLRQLREQQQLLIQQQERLQEQLSQQHQELLRELRTPSPRPSGRASNTSRDTRVSIRTLRSAGWTYQQIATHLHLTLRQVQHAATTQATPRRPSGRPPILTVAQVEELIEFVCSSRKARRMAYWRLPQELGWDCSVYAIRNALRRAGFKRYVARRKPPITEPTRLKRLAFAQRYVNWTLDEWKAILWSDETWVTGGRHTRTWVTRKPGEELNPTCIVERHQRKKGWMFWGCFSGRLGKGPGVFWEKDWGTISAASYIEHIIPIICGWHRLHPDQGLIFMQDNAPAHTAAESIAEIKARGIRIIEWPPYSPDLNPIETVWNEMKDYIERHFPEDQSYDRLRAAVKEAWEAIPESFFMELLESMRDRCQAVIDANGMHTRF